MSQLNETLYPAALERYNALKSERNLILLKFETSIGQILFGGNKPDEIVTLSDFNGRVVRVMKDGDHILSVEFFQYWGEQYESLRVEYEHKVTIMERDFQERLFWIGVEQTIYSHTNEIRNEFEAFRTSLKETNDEFYRLSSDIANYEYEVREAKKKAARDEVEKTLGVGKGIAYLDNDGKIIGGILITKITPKRIYGRQLYQSYNYKHEPYCSDYGDRFYEKYAVLDRINLSKYKVVEDLKKAIVQGE